MRRSTPYAERLPARCDAVLRIGGLSSQGADEMVRIARAAGKQIFHDLNEIPPA
ncbi:hypothetical protein [Allokutzneria albata]|uniref:hypothetical protein n=1 Tax=Allokutzneria albata TaxID=211114 RepID=UPI000AB0FA30|nr:hypothetical protein [Allokutzneria albata]